MKSIRAAMFLLIALGAGFLSAQSNSQSAFEKIKSLEGTWSGTSSDGRHLQVSFRVVSGGSAVESEIHGEHEADMISVFHMDGDRLMMTHYCGTGNQPRMVGTMSADGKTISFAFLDATNLLPSQPGHMEHMTLTLPDSNRQTEQWDFLAQDGQHQQHAVFELHRDK